MTHEHYKTTVLQKCDQRPAGDLVVESLGRVAIDLDRPLQEEFRDVLVPDEHPHMRLGVAAVHATVEPVRLPLAEARCLSVLVRDGVRVVEVLGRQLDRADLCCRHAGQLYQYCIYMSFPSFP